MLAGEAGSDIAVGTSLVARGWLVSATLEQQAALLAAGRRVCIPSGHRLFSAGAPPGGIYGVLSGGIAVEGNTNWHAPRLCHVFRAGDWFGHGPALTGNNRTMGYVALEESILFAIPLAPLRRMMRDSAEMARLVGQLADLNTNLASWIACDLLIPDAPRRVAAVLVRVTGAMDGVEPSDARGYLLTQAVLGEMSNVSRAHVNRALGQFARAGWIAKSYSHLRILNLEALEAFAHQEV